MHDRPRCLLADGTGLGKTVQTLGLIARLLATGELQRGRGALVIVPATLVPQWTAEARKYLSGALVLGSDEPAAVTNSKQWHAWRADNPNGADVEVISYEKLAAGGRAGTYAAKSWALVVLDEASAVKGGGKQANAAQLATRNAARVVALGATPVEMSTWEMYQVLRVVGLDGLFGTPADFRGRFAILDAYDPTKVKGSRNVEEFAGIVAPYVLRRLPEDVGITLPARTGPEVIAVPLLPAQQAAYAAADRHTDDLRRWHAREKACDYVVSMGRGYSAKVSEALRLIEARPGRKGVIGFEKLDPLHFLSEQLDGLGIGHVILEGVVDATERERRIERFRTDPGVSLALGSGVLSRGVDRLSVADYFIDLAALDNPATIAQREGRLRRIGSPNATYEYVRIVTGTVHDRKREAKLIEKTAVATVALSGATGNLPAVPTVDVPAPTHISNDAAPLPTATPSRGEPATASDLPVWDHQRTYVERLAARAGVEPPVVRTIAEASAAIRSLESVVDAMPVGRRS